MRFKTFETNKHKWHPWFAWFPVKVQEFTTKGGHTVTHWAWLETVSRRFGMNRWVYGGIRKSS